MLWRAFDKTVRRKPLSFAVDAMGFQSTLVWKLLERRLLAGHPSNRSSSNSNHEGKAHDRLIVTRDRPFFKTPNLGISDVACFGHAIASAAKRLRSHVSAVSEARFHDKVGGEAGDVARVRYSR